MTKFEEMIGTLTKIKEDLKPELQKAYEVDSHLNETLERVDELLYSAITNMKAARKRISEVKVKAVAMQEKFPDEQ